MTIFRILVFGVLLALAAPGARPALADAPLAKPSATAHPETPEEDATWTGTGGIYRIMAMSAGVLAGAGAMSLFIDGWVVELFQRTGNMTATEAIEIVQDIDSQGGFEAAAIVLSGLAGGLVADKLYLKAVAWLPGALDHAGEKLRPTTDVVGNAWNSASGWTGERLGDASDWLQNRSRELWDRTQMWGERLRDGVLGK